MTISRILWPSIVLGSLLANLPIGCERATGRFEDTSIPASVKWQHARPHLVSEWIEVTGTAHYPVRHVTATVQGRVLSILQSPLGTPILEGQQVKKGDVIAQLDDGIARAKREELAANLEELRQQVRQAELTVKLHEIEVRGLDELGSKSSHNSPLISPIEVEKAKIMLEEAKSRMQQADLRVQAGESELKALNEELRRYMLTAPLSGRLGRIRVAPGQTLTVCALVDEIVDPSQGIDLLGFVSPTVARKFREGQEVRLGALEGRPGSPIADETLQVKLAQRLCSMGHIVFVADRAEVSAGNFAVKARFPNACPGIHGNVTYKAHVQIAKPRPALTLPESAIMEDEESPRVIVVTGSKLEMNKTGKEIETGQAHKLRVKLGIRDQRLQLVEIVAVEDPERKGGWQGSLDAVKFVVKGGDRLRNDDRIKLELEKAQGPAPKMIGDLANQPARRLTAPAF
jgi:RND family efflux transporter MFP subunit